MLDSGWRVGRYIETEQPVEHRRFAIVVQRRELAIRDFFAAILQQPEPQEVLSHVPENIAGSGMVQSHVNCSLVCQSLAQPDSDQSTTPASACGQDPSNPRLK
jgi:hypothetical protein